MDDDGVDGVENESMTSSMRDRAFGEMLGTDTATEATQRDLARMGVCERLYYIGCSKEKVKQDKLRHDRESKVMEELAQVTARPAITRRATKLPAKGNTFADQASMWQDRMESKRLQMMAETVEQERVEATFSPQLNKRSQELKKNYHGPVSAWEKHFAKFCAKKNVESPPQEFRPNINESSRSRTVNSEGGETIGDRLYSGALKKQEKMTELAKLEMERSLYDPATGQKLFQPTTLNHSSRNPSEVSEELYNQHSLNQKKKEQLVRKFSHDSNLTFSPAIDAHSATMMENTTRKPLYSPQRNRSPNPPASEVSQTSSKIIKKADVEKFLLRNEKSKLQHQSRMTLLKEQLAEKEKRECTFSPRVSAASEKIFDASSYSGKSPQRSQRSPAFPPPPPPQDHLPPSYYSREQFPTTPVQKTPPTSRVIEAAPPSGPTSRSASTNVEQYISNFEKEMFAVLDQWKKLEEV
jgi:hypothetical protein